MWITVIIHSHLHVNSGEGNSMYPRCQTLEYQGDDDEDYHHRYNPHYDISCLYSCRKCILTF